jgi:hypothetical protein
MIGALYGIYSGTARVHDYTNQIANDNEELYGIMQRANPGQDFQREKHLSMDLERKKVQRTANQANLESSQQQLKQHFELEKRLRDFG